MNEVGNAVAMLDGTTTKELLQTLILILDLGGTFAFALSGAMAGVRSQLDIFGVLVISFAASTAGGITRDLLIGAIPPASLQDWRYLAVSTAAGVTCFYWSSLIEKLRNPMRMLDAMGLALFAVSGAEKALSFGLSPLMSALLGMLTGIGGGIARDVLLTDVPAVLRSDLYAVAALAGAAAVVMGSMVHFPVLPTAFFGGVLCFGIRVAAIRRGWRLPLAHRAAPPSDGR